MGSWIGGFSSCWSWRYSQSKRWDRANWLDLDRQPVLQNEILRFYPSWIAAHREVILNSLCLFCYQDILISPKGKKLSSHNSHRQWTSNKINRCAQSAKPEEGPGPKTNVKRHLHPTGFKKHHILSDLRHKPSRGINYTILAIKLRILPKAPRIILNQNEPTRLSYPASYLLHRFNASCDDTLPEKAEGYHNRCQTISPGG